MVTAASKMKTLALISPNKNAYSETFIAAHKERLPFRIKYYYNGIFPKELLGTGELERYKIYHQFVRMLRDKLRLKPGKPREETALAKSFKKEKIDAVLAEYGTTGASVTNVCQKLNIPLLVHFHGYDAADESILEKYRHRYTTMFEYASFVFSVSATMTQQLTQLGCPAQKIIYNPCGSHEDFFKINKTGNQNTFVSIGRFTDKKAPYYTILAFNKVQAVYPDAKLILAGDGVLKNTCANLINHLRIADKVTLIGVVTKEQWIVYLSNAFAFLQHSITAANGDMEGTPVAILEACAAGLPVVATKHGGITDVIQHECNGLLVNEHDVNDMAAQMMYLLENKCAANRLGEAARKTVCEQFNMQHHIDVITNKINASLRY